ncbi:MAG: dockerin type I domain-containing protein [Ruminococcus sp.]|nr:dockerin type I domain-containing protein [Ruminococcus sp.]
MKKSSKVLSMVLAILTAMSCFTGMATISASAAEDHRIYFQVPTIEEWGTTKSVFCHIYHVYGEQDTPIQTPAWQSKSESCKKDAATGLYYYDVDSKLKAALTEGCDYALLFSTKDTNGAAHQTCNVTLSTECYGGTVYVTGELVENTEDSSKMDYAATWTDPELAAKYGPKAAITSTGKVVGNFFPANQPKQQIVSQFLHSWAVINASIIDANVVASVCEQLAVDPQAVYDQYAADYAGEFGDVETYPNTASLEVVAALLNISSTPSTEATEPSTEATEPSTEATEPSTEATEPSTEATEPSTEATEPSTEATEPSSEVVPSAPLRTVAGDAGLTGYSWAPEENAMTFGAYNFDGVDYDYAITFEYIPAGSYSFKVTDGTWTNAWGNGDQNYGITMTSEADVTIYYSSVTNAIAVESAGLGTFELTSITAVGNGDGTWLNGASWDTTDASNNLTEVTPGVWSITYTNIDAFDNYQVKFACNYGWAYNWASDGTFDGQTNPSIVVEEDGSTVTLTIDVNGFDFNTKTGTVAISIDIQGPAPAGPVYGDVNNDDKVDINDVTYIQRYIVEMELDIEFNTEIADVTADGKVNVHDVTCIQKYLSEANYETGRTGELVA